MRIGGRFAVLVATVMLLGTEAALAQAPPAVPVKTMPTCVGFKQGRAIGQPATTPSPITGSANTVIFYGAIDPQYAYDATVNQGHGFRYVWSIDDGSGTPALSPATFTSVVTGTANQANDGSTTYLPPYGGGTARIGYLQGSHSFPTAGNFLASLDVQEIDGRGAVVAESIVQLPIAIANPDPVSNSNELETRIAETIQENLRFLYRNVSSNGSNISAGYIMGETGLALLAFENQNHLPGTPFASDIFGPAVTLMLNFVTGGLTIGDNTNPYGTSYVYDGLYTSSDTYYASGICLTAIVGSEQPNLLVQSPRGITTTAAVVQQMVDFLAATQSPATTRGCGGWHYSIGDGDSDGSVVAWVMIGLFEAETAFGVIPSGATLAADVKSRSKFWDDNFHAPDGGVFYGGSAGSGSLANLAKTGPFPVEWLYGDPRNSVTDPQVATAFSYMYYHFYDGETNPSGNSNTFPFGAPNSFMIDPVSGITVPNPNGSGYYYGLYNMSKGFRVAGISLLAPPDGTLNPPYSGYVAPVGTTGTAIDWYASFAEFITRQTEMFNAGDGNSLANPTDGGQPGSGVGSRVLQTAWSVLTLTQTLLGGVPVPVIDTSLSPSGGFAGISLSGQSIDFNGAKSRHLDKNKQIVAYDWNFGDGTTASGVAVSHRYTLPQGTSQQNFVITLTVGDNSNPEVKRATAVQIKVTTNTAIVPPVANPGGPYVAKINTPIALDGSRSFDPNGQAITFAWDLNGDGNFGDAADDLLCVQSTNSRAVRPKAQYAQTGSIFIALKVTNQSGLNTSAKTTVLSVFTELPPALSVTANGQPTTLLAASATTGTILANTLECDGFPTFDFVLDPSQTANLAQGATFKWEGVDATGAVTRTSQIARFTESLTAPTFIGRLTIASGQFTSVYNVVASFSDTLPPSIGTLPEVDLVEPEGVSQVAFVLSTPMATDACWAAVTVTSDAPAIFLAGTTTTVHWTFTDGAGNTAQASQNVVVSTATAVVVTVQGRTVTLTGGGCAVSARPADARDAAGALLPVAGVGVAIVIGRRRAARARRRAWD